MKRHPALAPLSRDHHHTLVVSRMLREAGVQQAPAATERWRSLWQEREREHFRKEEEVLAPALAAHPSGAPLRERMLAEHRQIRARSDALLSSPDPARQTAALAALGELLRRHVRFEENELFPLLEASLDAEQLEEIGRRLA
ncbi:MAG TPA: hemerythrin domain-containing protein [Solirubrobacteraceae bacterium]|nr:hemerythrin domain-containing protein [Solirubrobacteraceae bacterium]